jgi:hypothetical protein
MGHYVELAANGAGEYVDTYQVSDGTNNVDRQGVVLVDDTTYAARAKVQNGEPGTNDYGVTMRRACAGASFSHTISAASANPINLKASAGRVTGWTIFNNAAYPVYLKFHNTSGTPTPGSGVVYTVGVQAGSTVIFDDDDGLAFSSGIGISITLGITDADTTATAANDCVVNVHYK